MIESFSDICLLAGNSNKALAQEIADNLALPLCSAKIGKFSDGEINVTINESVRGRDVFVIQSLCYPVNDNLMELLIIIDALKRASAGRINVVMPYYGYARQDRKEKGRVPITARLVADMLTTAGADRVISIDLHADQIQGFFNIPFDRLYGRPIIADYILSENESMDNVVVVSPDAGSVKRSRKLAEYLNVPLAIIDKRRPKDNVAEVMNVIGEVRGKKVIMIDDMIDTGGTIVGAANALEQLGASKIICACTHPVLSGPAVERIESSAIDRLIATNTIPLTADKKIDKITVLSVAPLLAKAIKIIHTGKSISSIFS
ncbi:ribose-phosphate pyrophosphokinase [Anaerofustis stercorihominis]|uniref:Ribose-phosphate pyrophosphokinase n=1 Tax=Anaerofustis stercorihominis DSM 17244 TaxID=445971 RepID=B1CAK1_9FIRM|nr:ribose-phosphate pyrophosphokinase [Anaerofustis stercorihominis]EDS72474.1 ribose-phosphate diphosphokinase [Anaerofustis stercorihominis DSM 17244]MCQ4795286.1 ribose-phosphate pyrophosphokinase [Anaerofustis stercorihominis]